MDILKQCTLCPRSCKVNRYEHKGFCGETSAIRIARWDLHFWEEPCISGPNGSGTVFFSGCCLKCCFCQNFEISAEGKGYVISTEELANIFMKLQDKGANNINLVNPTHFVPQIIKALDLVKNKLTIPVVYNTGGYESVNTIKMLEGYVDIYLPDLKFYSREKSERYSKAKDYFEHCIPAIKQMISWVGKPKFNSKGLMTKGIIIRHMVMPSNREDSIYLLKYLDNKLDKNDFLLSLMSQFTPTFKCNEYPEINRRISTFEYNKVLDVASQLGFNGFMQEKSSAKEEYVPCFFSEKKK